jgi:hypothetical protein
MTPEQFGFWNLCRSLSYPFNYNLVFDGRTIASYFEGTGKNTAYRLANKLCKMGWLVCTKKSKRGKYGLWDSAEYQVLSHEEWLAKDEKRKCKLPVPEAGLRQERHQIIQSQKQEQSSPRNGNDPVPELGRSIEYNPILSKQRIEELRFPWQAPLKTENLKEAEKGLGKAENVPPVPETGQVVSTPVLKTGQVELFPELRASDQRGPETKNSSAEQKAFCALETTERLEESGAERGGTTPTIEPLAQRGSESDGFEGMTASEVIASVPREVGMVLYNNTGGRYTRTEAVAFVSEYRSKQTPKVESPEEYATATQVQV